MGNHLFGRSARRQNQPQGDDNAPPVASERCDRTRSIGESTPKPPEATGSSEDRQTGGVPESRGEVDGENVKSKETVDGNVKAKMVAEVVVVEEKRRLQVLLSLYCITTGERSVHRLDELPSSVHLLKEYIESKHSIPVCSQKILFDFIPLSDSQILPLRYMRNGDTIEVQYKHTADVEDIRNILNQLNDINACLESLREVSSNIPRSNPTGFHKILTILRLRGLERLVYQHFHCENEDHQEANLLFFLHNDGLAQLYRLHCLLLARPWGTLPQAIQYVENTLVTTFWDITDRCNQFGLHVELAPVVDNIAKSSLRGDVREKKSQSGGFFLDTIYKATGALCNLAELPQYRVLLASNQQLMLQFIALMQSSAYNYHTSLVTMAGMVCLTYSRKTHQYLCTPEIIDGVLETCKIRRKGSMAADAVLLRYFASLFFSILVTSSPVLIKEAHVGQISALLKEFLSEADHQDIHNKEDTSGFYWLTLVPHMTVAYFPFNYQLPSKVAASDDAVSPLQMTELYLLCMELGVFSLQNVTTADKHRKVLAKEGLVDYVHCLPWYLSSEGNAQERACQLASELKPLLTQPPSLTNISRARLASMHFGLEKVLSKQPCEIYMELHSSPTHLH